MCPSQILNCLCIALLELDVVIYSDNVVLFNNLWKGLKRNVEK